MHVPWSLLPALAAGGIMDGAGVAAALARGGGGPARDRVRRLPGVVGRRGPPGRAPGPARGPHRGDGGDLGPPPPPPRQPLDGPRRGRRTGAVPDYPIAYDAGKALPAAAKAAGEFGNGAQWAGRGAPLARALPAAGLVARLGSELAEALARRDD